MSFNLQVQLSLCHQIFIIASNMQIIYRIQSINYEGTIARSIFRQKNASMQTPGHSPLNCMTQKIFSFKCIALNFN